VKIKTSPTEIRIDITELQCGQSASSSLSIGCCIVRSPVVIIGAKSIAVWIQLNEIAFERNANLAIEYWTQH